MDGNQKVNLRAKSQTQKTKATTHEGQWQLLGFWVGGESKNLHLLLFLKLIRLRGADER